MKFLLIFFTITLSLLAQDPVSNPQKDSVAITQEIKFIELSDVPQNASETLSALKTIQADVKENPKSTELHSLVQPYIDSLNLLLESKNYQNIEKQNTRELQKMGSEIAVYMKQLENWDGELKQLIELYDTNKQTVEKFSKTWTLTHTNALEENAPDTILESISAVIIEIEQLDNTIKNNYDKSLTNSQKVTSTILQLQELDSTITSSEIKAKNNVFFQNQAPLIQALDGHKLSFIEFLQSTKTISKEKYQELSAYFQTNPNSVIRYMILEFFVLVFIIYFFYLYKKEKLFVYKESLKKKEFFFLARPISTFMVLSVLGMSIMFKDKPGSLGGLQLLLILIPSIRILQTLIQKEFYKYIYMFLGLYLVYIIDKNASGYELESRILQLLISFSLFAFIISFLSQKVLYTIKENFLTKLGNFILWFYAFLLIVSFISNIYGFELLSRRVVTSIFITMYTSFIFYITYSILTAYIVIMLRRRISSATNVLDIYAKKIEFTTKILIKTIMITWWLMIVTKNVGLYPIIISAKDSFLALSWQVSDMTISVDSIFHFLFILFTTWFIARVTKTILEIEVFARFEFPRGMPTAILTTLNYTIIISGTIIAFSSLGISAQQFALLFGALGVGIGFGLRNIIANFVSGIIMVFERPVQIGDTIEVDKTVGSVQSIGARSSVIKTFDGSEVIIPNADFIAKEITNWTLSNEHRRKTIEFKVALDNDIEKIQALLYDVAISHPNTLKDPEPLATFQGFGEYYLEFKLYFWLAENMIVAQSEIAREIYARLQEEGIKMPVPSTYIEK